VYIAGLPSSFFVPHSGQKRVYLRDSVAGEGFGAGEKEEFTGLGKAGVRVAVGA